MKRGLALLLLLTAPAPAMAAVDNSLVAMGYGTSSCAEFTQAYLSVPHTEDLYFDWAQGFMSGINATLIASKQPGHDMNRRSVENQRASLREYCSANPGAPFATAVAKMLFAFPPPPP